ncbi:MAG: hypothetical protein H8K07_01570 [Nitrospira sp.]|nr:hypothetical protein [Nitrospira sp.]
MRVNPPAQMTLHVDSLGRGTIVVNGVNVSGLVNSITIDTRVGDLTHVCLRVPAATLTAEMEAVLSIYLVKDDEADASRVSGAGSE